jgi:hypothetical protein
MKISIGNHDIEDLEALMDYFGLSEQYYSFDYQNVHFISLGTEEEYLDMSNDKAKEQLAFVQSDLEKASSNPNIDWIIPFFHRIMYYESEGGLVDTFDHNLVDIYHPLFEKYGVNLVLDAHTHTYERTYPLRINSEGSEAPIVTSNDLSNYRSVDGLVIATVGTGGAKPTNAHVANELVAVQYENLFGFLNVDVSADGTKLVGTFYDNNGDGEIRDQFTITKSSVTIEEEEEEEDDDDQIGIEDELEDESEDVDGEDEVSIAASDEENGNEEFGEEDVDEDDDDNIGFDIDDSILVTETSSDEE